MKKIFLAFLAIIAVSCGKYETVTKSTLQVGDRLSVTSANLSGVETQNLNEICNALAQKEGALPSAINSSFNFFTNETDCDNNSVASANGPVDVVLQGSGGSFVFKRLGGQDFMFPNVETTSSGLFQNICPALATGTTLSSPVISGSEAMFVTTQTFSTSDCPQLSDEKCAFFQKGTVQPDGTALIHTKEWIRIRTTGTNGKIGFFTYRKRVARSYCAIDKVISLTATMKP